MYRPGIPDLCVSPILQQQQQQQLQAAAAAFAVIAPLLSSLLGSLADAYPKRRRVRAGSDCGRRRGANVREGGREGHTPLVTFTPENNIGAHFCHHTSLKAARPVRDMV